MSDEAEADISADSGEPAETTADATSGDEATKTDAKESRSFFSRLNPFGGDKKEKETEKEKETRKLAQQQRARDEAEAKKRKDELERQRVQRSDLEETARMAAKREKYQRLLQKNPDTTRRVFQFRMKAIKLESISEEQIGGLFLKVTLGGDYQVREEPGKGLVKKGKHGQHFKTTTAPKLEQNSAHYYRSEFGSGIPIYWMGSYVDLEMEEFQIDLFQHFASKKSKKRSSWSTPLIQLAMGSVQQEVVLRDEKPNGERCGAPLARLHFVCYFEELFVFQLRFVQWRGTGLIAADTPKKKRRAEREDGKETKRLANEESRRQAWRNKMLAKQRAKENNRKMRIDRQRAAQSGGTYRIPSADDGSGTGATLSAAPATETGAGSSEGPTTSGHGIPSEGEGVRLITSTKSDGTQPGSGPSKRSLLSRIGLRRTSSASSASTPSGGKRTNKKLTFAERVELQKRHDKEKKEAREAKELQRLRNLKRQQDLKAEKNRARSLKEQEKKIYDPELYEDPTSDPYIVFSIDPPSAPGCKILRTGGYFGRTVRTDMMTNTLNPSFEEARKPLAYLGTRSELENELLRIRVYDWDFFSSDDLIGQADVPLNGVLEYGQLEVELTLDQPDTTRNKVRGKYPKVTKPAGKLSGQILFEGRTPEYQQLGLLIERKPGITYLAVRVNSATRLIPADPNGQSDPFVVVDWDGAQQTTKVIPRTLEPVWKQTLYFPLKLVTLSQQSLAGKPPISIRVFDQDEAGHDLLGSCEVPLHRVTSAAHAKIEHEIGADGRVHKGRVLKLPVQPLVLPGHKIQSTLDVEIFFCPDLALDIVLEEQAERQVKELDEKYANRVKTFWKALPGRIQMRLTDATRIEFGRETDGFEMTTTHIRRLVSAEDQDEVHHLFCEYLAPQQPPSDLTSMLQVARMVRCVTWAADAVVFKKDQRCDIWQSPSFFLEMRKGDHEDHALLLCNLFLGMGEDAYVCVGRLKGCAPNEKRHVWVLTRHRDRSVQMWETTTGQARALPDRWSPPESAEELAARQRAEAQKAKDERSRARASKRGWFRGRSGKALAAGPSAHPSAEGANVDEAAEVDELLAIQAVGTAGDSSRGGAQQNTSDAALLDSAQELFGLMHDETLTKADIEAPIKEVVFYDDMEHIASTSSGAIDGGAGADSLEIQVRHDRPARDAWQSEIDRLRKRADEEALGRGVEDNGWDPILAPVNLPYESLECIFNHKQLWISKNDKLSRPLDPALLLYDLPDVSDGSWEAFVEPRMINEGLPKAFYATRRLAAKVAADRLRNMEAQILGEIEQQIKILRSNKPPIINKSTDLVSTLVRGLELHESRRRGDEDVAEKISQWEREVKVRLPAGSTLSARAFNYSYTDAKKIRKHLLQSATYAKNQGDGIEFTIAVKAFAFHGGICSVWVYFGLIDNLVPE